MLKKGEESAAGQPPFPSSPLKSHAVNLLDVVGTPNLHTHTHTRCIGAAGSQIFFFFFGLLPACSCIQEVDSSGAEGL